MRSSLWESLVNLCGSKTVFPGSRIDWGCWTGLGWNDCRLVDFFAEGMVFLTSDGIILRRVIGRGEKPWQLRIFGGRIGFDRMLEVVVACRG